MNRNPRMLVALLRNWTWALVVGISLLRP